MVDAISEKRNESEVVVAMKVGKDALKRLHEEMGVDDVLELMDEIEDGHEVERQINELLGGEGMSAGEMADADVAAELEALEREVEAEAKGEAGPGGATSVAEEVKEEEEEEKPTPEEETNAPLPEVPTKPLPSIETTPNSNSEQPAKVAVAS